MGANNFKPMVASSNETSATTTTSQIATISSRQRIFQNFMLIWMDGNIDPSSQNCQNSLAQLRNIVNDVKMFTNSDECVDFMTEIESEKVFLLVEGTIGKTIVPLIHGIPQLDTIYIVCDNKSTHEQWSTKWDKVKGTYTQIASICDALQLAIKQCNQDSIAMSFVTVNEGSFNQNLNQLEPSFMYTQIFKEILLEMKHDEQSIKALVSYCREKYPDNTREQNIIDEFARDYRSETSLWWYTRECFTYQMLNRALRTLEGDTIVNMGSFICDLHRQLEHLHREQVDDYHGQLFIVYRGQGLSITDFDKLLKTKGGLMSFNNFLSTSKERDVSLKFAERASKKTEMVGILFHMSIDPSISSTPFALINKVSYYKTEEEVLFSMHTVFRIDLIQKINNNDRLYQVNLRLTADDDQQLRTLTQRIREETGGYGWERMGNLLTHIGQFNKAEELYNVLLDQASNENQKAAYYNQLGYIKGNQGDHKKELSFYEKAREIKENTLPPNHHDLASSLGNIGGAYSNMGEYSKALSFYNKAREIQEKSLPPDHSLLAISYHNIGLVYKKMGEYLKALSFNDKAREIEEKILPPNHPLLADSYSNTGLVYQKMGDYSKALLFYDKAREIREKTLPPDHPSLATSYNNFGTLYHDMGQYSKSISFLERALNIFQISLPLNHPHLQVVRESIEIVRTKL